MSHLAVFEKRWVLGLAALLLAASTRSAHADIIEIKGGGFENGEIVAEDAASVTFKNSRGEQSVIPRDKIAYLEKEKKKSLLEKTSKTVKDGYEGLASKMGKSAEKSPAKPARKPQAPAKFKPDPTTQAQFAAANDKSRSLAERKEALKIAMRRAKSEGVDFRGMN